MYKIGDWVRVREDLEPECHYDGLYFAGGMAKNIGKAFQIKEIEKNSLKAYYSLDRSGFVYNESMLMSLSSIRDLLNREKEKT